LGAQLEALGASSGGRIVPASTPTLSSPPSDITVADAASQYLVARARSGRSDRYLRQLRVVLDSFAKGRARVPIDRVSVRMLEDWLDSSQWSPRTKAGYLADVRTWLHWCMRRAWMTSNPAAAVDPPAVRSPEPPSIHTPAQVRAVLEASRSSPDVCRQLALRYFAGLRSSEVMKLREEHLLRDRGVIEVPALLSKTRRRRLVRIQPNLEAWLDLGGTLRGMRELTVRQVIARSGVPWSQNVTRHSFVSYHLAQFEQAGRTALESGHSEAILFRHYRALVAPAAAAEYWEIRPDPAAQPRGVQES
jgi:integrase